MPISDNPRILEWIGAPYALIGGQAVIIRGHIRPTFDYDFLTSDAAALQPSSWVSLEGADVNVRKGDYDDQEVIVEGDRKSTRLNSSHQIISYAVFCLKKKNHTYSSIRS